VGHNLGAVVVSYHSIPDLKLFLASWEKYNTIDAELRGVFVEANDEDANFMPEVVHEDHLYASYGDNIGYGRACNEMALSLPDSDTLAFFNADTELREGVLESCIETLWSDPTYAVVGPRQVDRAGHITHAGIFNATRPVHRGWQSVTDDFTDVRDDCCTVSGSAYFIKKSVWDELTDCPIYQECFPKAMGAFAPMPHYYEETTCSYHARSHDYKIVYDGRRTMIHNWAPSTSGFHIQAMTKSRESFRHFCDLHGIERD
jgi:GT2 family glycosyltransferase